MSTMPLPRRRLLKLAAANLALTSLAAPALTRVARAQTYPSRPITMIVPYAAGGPTDTVGRVVAERMRAELGQSVVLENVGGAGGSIGLGRLARSAPDGYTINVGNWSAHVINGAIYSLLYDLRTDFEPIALLAQAPQMVVAKKATPADDLNSFIAWLKANPNRTAGTAGIGSPPHIGGVLFQNMTDTALQFVHYRGVALATQDLVAGQIDMVIADPTTATPQVRAGTIRPMRSRRRRGCRRYRTCPPPTRPACPGFTSQPGTRCSRRRARRRPSSTSSTPRRSPRSPIPRCARALPRSARTFRRASSRRPKRSARSTGPISRSGGRS